MDCGTYSWLRTGDEVFAAMLAAINAARDSVRLETYIFSPGAIADRFCDALVRASERGVRVRVLLDAFGSLNVNESYWSPFKQAGGEFRWFNPLHLGRWTFRDHRKLLVGDESTAFVGGYNIAAEYEGDGVKRGWRDLGLRLSGPLVRELADAFDAQFAAADMPHRLFTRLRKSSARQAIACPDGELLLSGPGRGRNAIKRALLADLATARHVRIVAAYFLPTVRLRRALMRAARHGAQVQLILPAKSDMTLSQLASHSFYHRLLRAGVEVYEYQPQVLHTKLVVVDHAVYVGSSNLDARSLHINYELMLRLTPPPVRAEAESIFAEHLAHARRIPRRAWPRSRTCWNKLKERWACFLLARLDPLLMRRQLKRLQK